MKTTHSPAYWHEVKNKLRKKYPQLTTSDFQHAEGKEESMMRLIEYKLRLSKESMKKILESSN